MLVGNYTLIINGYITQNHIIPIFNPRQNFDIGLIFIILACAIPFIAFAVHRFRKIKGD